VDLTPISDRVVRRASLLPLDDDASVTLLHVVPEILSPQNRRRAGRDAMKTLTAEARHLRASLGRHVRVEPLVSVGVAAKAISDCATSTNVELILVGRGSGRMSDVFLGSTAERVIRQATRPVLVVRPTPRRPYGRPLLALKLDRTALEVVRLTVRAVPSPQAQVVVIHAYDDPLQRVSYPSLSGVAHQRKVAVRLSAARELKDLLLRALRNAQVSSAEATDWTTLVRAGSPRVVIEETVRKMEPDLVVMGTRGHAGAGYFFSGTVAGDVLRRARCDVLVVPPAPRR
jgi:nucleotide-binding universal stress UspA family protein